MIIIKRKMESEKKRIEIYTTDYDLAEIIKNTTKDCDMEVE